MRGGRKLLSGDDSSKFMIQGEMEKSHRYAYSVHAKGGGRKTTKWRKNNKFMIQEETENIKEWQVYSSY